MSETGHALKVRGRRASIRRLFEAGFNVVQISKKVAASRWTVTRDLETIGLARFSDISDFDLDELVAGEYLASHLALGSLALEARLLTLGYHIPRARLRKSRARLGVVHARPMRIKRLKWYEARGVDGVWSTDQNEALQRYRISSFVIIDAFSRNPIHYELTTGLSGGDHTRFYCNALERMLKAPECVSVDMTDCWNGVKVITRAIYGNNDAVPFEVGGVHLSARHFHQTLSKKNTPVERHWREWNPMLVRFYERFHALEVEGILDPRCVKDLFCLHRVFLPEIQNVMDRHYTSLRMQKKTKSTRNPNYPAGTHRRSHLYTMLPSRGKLLTPRQVEGLRALAEEYWQNRHPASLAPRPWEHDPVITRRGRARRARCIVRHAPTTLEAEYRLFRFCTLDLSARDL